MLSQVEETPANVIFSKWAAESLRFLTGGGGDSRDGGLVYGEKSKDF